MHAEVDARESNDQGYCDCRNQQRSTNPVRMPMERQAVCQHAVSNGRGCRVAARKAVGQFGGEFGVVYRSMPFEDVLEPVDPKAAADHGHEPSQRQPRSAEPAQQRNHNQRHDRETAKRSESRDLEHGMHDVWRMLGVAVERFGDRLVDVNQSIGPSDANR